MQNIQKILLATRNKGKAREFQELLGPDWIVSTVAEYEALPEVVEDGDTFEANACKKAVEISRCVEGLVLADDSGLEVDFLEGAPGVYSARFAGEPSDDAKNNTLLLEKLAAVPMEQRGAQFCCVLALARHGEVIRTSKGICRGRIQENASGDGGFGYDPLFVPDAYSASFAELGHDIKNSISHRAKAFVMMSTFLKNR